MQVGTFELLTADGEEQLYILRQVVFLIKYFLLFQSKIAISQQLLSFVNLGNKDAPIPNWVLTDMDFF